MSNLDKRIVPSKNLGSSSYESNVNQMLKNKKVITPQCDVTWLIIRPEAVLPVSHLFLLAKLLEFHKNLKDAKRSFAVSFICKKYGITNAGKSKFRKLKERNFLKQAT